MAMKVLPDHRAIDRLKDSENSTQNMERLTKNILAVGIDIGNLCTKCGMSFVSGEPTSILLLNDLIPNELSKAYPTIVLLDDNEQFKCFGYDSIGDHMNEQGHLFREIKQPLYSISESVGEGKYINDELGRKTPAVKVLHAIIQRIKDHVLNKIGTIADILREDITWVFTVPAVFNVETLSIVKNAALMAGIADNDLCIVQEPEAALEYCFIMQNYKQPRCTSRHTSFTNRKRFMVVDIGGTLDVTVLEKDKFGTHRQLYKLHNVEDGGNMLHKALDNALKTIIGPEVYEMFRAKDVCNNFHRDFDKKVKNEDLNSSKTLYIHLTGSEVFGGSDFIDSFQNSTFAENIYIERDKLKISSTFWQEILREFSCRITCFMREVFTKQAHDTSLCVVIVGGYADFKIIQESLIREFPEIDIFIPSDAQFATVHGAVLLGHKPYSNKDQAQKHASVNTLNKYEGGNLRQDDDLQGQALGNDFVQSINEMSNASDFLGDVVVHSFSKLHAGIMSLQQKMAGRPQGVCMKRKDVISDAITAYRDIDVHRPIEVRFAGEEERDVTKEMFHLFWEKISNVWFKGENAVIPLVPVTKGAEARHVFTVLGKILEHTLCILGHFPPQICRSLILVIAHPDKDVDADLVLEDYLLFLPERESELLAQSLEQTEWSENRKKRLERFFSVNNIYLQLTPTSLKENVLNIAYAEIIDSSHVYMSLMGRGISDFAKAHVFNVLDTDTLKAEYRAREVTTEKVAQVVEAMLDKSEYSREEKRIINYASNFVSDLSKKQLRHFLIWLTGSSNMPQKIEITFNTSRGLTRTPTVHRDKNMLELSRDYSTYQDFKQSIMDAFLNESSI